MHEGKPVSVYRDTEDLELAGLDYWGQYTLLGSTYRRMRARWIRLVGSIYRRIRVGWGRLLRPVK